MLEGSWNVIPRLRVLLVHGGGFIPYQIGRLDGGSSRPRRRCARAAPAVPANSWTALLRLGAARRRRLRHLVDFAGPGHVLLGSDYPFAMGLDHPVEALDAAEPDQSERETILRGAGPFGGGQPGEPVHPERSTAVSRGERWTA